MGGGDVEGVMAVARGKLLNSTRYIAGHYILITDNGKVTGKDPQVSAIVANCTDHTWHGKPYRAVEITAL